MREIQDIGMIGLGLIGGSLAKALRRSYGDITIRAMDPDREALSTAHRDGIIDIICEDLEAVIVGIDLLFLCTPVDRVEGILVDIGKTLEPGTIVTDVGSIKGGVMESAERLLSRDVYFIGGHPMAGSENSGYGHSATHLFENAFYVLTPMEDMPIGPVQSMVEIISSIGAFPLIMDSRTHDRVVGAVSHLPHVVAAALVNAVANVDDSSRFKEKLAAGGFRDITRVASSNPDMWTSISLANREELLELTLGMMDQLERFSALLEDREGEEINAFYGGAKKYRDELPILQSGSLLSYYDIYVDIVDEPGVLGRVATILGEYNINIRNTRIIHSREHEPGCLVVTLTSVKEADRAVRELK